MSVLRMRAQAKPSGASQVPTFSKKTCILRLLLHIRQRRQSSIRILSRQPLSQQLLGPRYHCSTSMLAQPPFSTGACQ